jgi:hypothetical protein
MSERELNPEQIEAMAIIGPLIEWRFNEVFVDEDQKKFTSFLDGVRFARQRQFALKFPMADGRFYVHYSMPNKGEGFKRPNIWMQTGEETMLPESLLDVLAFDVGQTSLFENKKDSS